MVKTVSHFETAGHLSQKNLRKTIEGILFRLRTSCQWADIPSCFGKSNSICQSFNRWSKRGIFTKLFKQLVDNPDMEWVFMDGSHIRVHQHGMEAQSITHEAVGKLLEQLDLSHNETVCADRSFDSDTLRKLINTKQSKANIPYKKNREHLNVNIDWYLYKIRHLVENASTRLKHFRTVAMRYYKLKRNYESRVSLACALIWLKL